MHDTGPPAGRIDMPQCAMAWLPPFAPATNLALRGATMGLHSMCGYAGGFIGPLGVGLALDFAGKSFVLGWGLGFGQLAIISLVGLIFVRRLG
jgi:hypothetical protein